MNESVAVGSAVMHAGAHARAFDSSVVEFALDQSRDPGSSTRRSLGSYSTTQHYDVAASEFTLLRVLIRYLVAIRRCTQLLQPLAGLQEPHVDDQEFVHSDAR